MIKRLGNIEKAAILLIISTALSKTLGFARELIVAYKFGAGSISDAFLLTNSIPSLIFVSLGTAVGTNFIPYYHRIEGKNEKDRFTSNFLNISIVIMLIGCLLVNIFPQTVLKIFATGLPKETEHYAVIMLRIVIFSILPLISCNLLQAYLQANGRFGSTAAFGIVSNIVIIFMTLISTDKTYFFLSISTILANLMGFFIVYIEAKKSDFSYYKIFNPKDAHIKAIVMLTLPLIAEDLASSMSLIVDRNVASFLDKGTISGLSYAGTLANVAGTMIAGPIITASFPEFSKMISENNQAKLIEGFKKYLELICFILCPIAFFMVFNAKDIVVFIFEHGSLDASASKVVWECLICYAMGILPSGMQTYLIKIFYALQDTRTPVKIKVFALGCNIGLNLLMVQFWGHIGIALSTTISYVIAYMLLAASLKKKHGFTVMKVINLSTIKLVLMSAVLVGLVWIAFNHLIHISVLMVKIIFEGAFFVLLYVGILFLFRKDLLLTIKKHITGGNG